MMKRVLFTHTDLDGAGCRICFSLASQHIPYTDYRTYNCDYHNIDKCVMKAIDHNMIQKDTEVFFADICASRETMQMLKDEGYNVKIFDHHPTAEFVKEIFEDAVVVSVNEKGIMECGTSLLFKYFRQCALETNNNPYRKYFCKNEFNHFNYDMFVELVDTIRQWDTYEWKKSNNQKAKNLQTLFKILDMGSFCSKYLGRITNIMNHKLSLIPRSDMEFIISKNNAEQRIINKYNPDNVYTIDVRGYKCALICGYVDVNISELAYQFLTKYPEFDMFAIFTFSNGGKFEFRAVKDDIDLGKEIALPAGGGGHKLAAGANINSITKDAIIQMLVENLNM